MTRSLAAALLLLLTTTGAGADNADAPAGGSGESDMAACLQAAQSRDADATVLACSRALDAAGMPQAAMVDALTARARAHIVRHEAPAALEDLDRAIALRPDAAELRHLRALAEYDQGDDAGAVADTSEAIRLAPEAFDSYRLRAQARERSEERSGERSGAGDQAVADYAAAIRFGAPKDAGPTESAIRAGIALYVAGDAAAAVPPLDAAARDEPRAALWRNLAQLAARQPSVAAMSAAASGLDPAVWPAPLLLYYQGRLPQAELETAAQSPDPAQGPSAPPRQACEAALYVAARAQVDGSYPVAQAGFQQTAALCPPGTLERDAAAALAIVEARLEAAAQPALEDMFACQGAAKADDTPQILDHCGRALDIAALPDVWRLGALTQRADARFFSGDTPGAMADVEAALALRPDTANLYRMRGGFRFDAGEREGGLADLSYAVTLDPGLMPAWLDRGWIRARRGDWTGARADMDRAVALQPDAPRLYLSRGVVAWLAGDAKAAAQDFTAVIRNTSGGAPYAVVWAALAVKAGVAEAAETQSVGELALNPDGWPVPVLRMIHGQFPVQVLLDGAKTAPDPAAIKKRTCEAAFYGAELAKLEGRMQDTTTGLNTARETCTKGSLEYQATMVELGR